MITTTFSRKTIATFLIPLGALLFLELVPLLNASPIADPTREVTSVPTLSEQPKSGSIDGRAVMVVATGDVVHEISLCKALPKDVWVLLIFIYVLLMVFNLREQYRLYRSIRYWRFEALITAFFLLEWLVFDTCREQVWFPLTLLKIGLILFLIFEIKGLYQNSLKLAKEDQVDTN